MSLPEDGYLRLSHIIGNRRAEPPIPAVIPVSKSTWWAGVKSGRYPQPVRSLGARITAWRVDDIKKLIAQTGADVHEAQLTTKKKGRRHARPHGKEVCT